MSMAKMLWKVLKIDLSTQIQTLISQSILHRNIDNNKLEYLTNEIFCELLFINTKVLSVDFRYLHAKWYLELLVVGLRPAKRQTKL